MNSRSAGSAVVGKRRRGFTLLEVLLTLLLGALLLAAVGMAIDIHLRLLDVGRTEVEQAQLARALLRRIADDLRSAVQYKPLDTSKYAPQTGTSGDSSGSSQDNSTGTSSVDPTAETQTGVSALDALEPDRTSNLADSTVPPSVPGLYGNAQELQVDVSRLPRVDQLQSMLAASLDTSLTDRTSDVKTVAYFVVIPGETDAVLAAGAGDVSRGLVRREMDRATTAWAAQQGEIPDTQRKVQSLAPEVSEIQFQYYDGSQWLDQWDSVSQGGLPMAVQITIAVTRPGSGAAQTLSSRSMDAADTTNPDNTRIYQLLVHLPVAQPTGSQSGTEDTEQPTDNTNQGMTDLNPSNAGTTP